MEPSRSRKALLAVILLSLLAVAAFFVIRHFRLARAVPLASVDYSEIRADDSLSNGARALIRLSVPDSPPTAAAVGARPDPSGKTVRVRLPETLAPTADPAGHRLRVAIELSITGGKAAEAELREREEGMVKLVRFVLSRKVPAQIRSDSCRPELLERFNAFLTVGRAVDLRFLTLEPVAPGGAP